MRPKDHDSDKELYECFSCGERTVDPDTRKCGECGGELRNLSNPRDL